MAAGTFQQYNDNDRLFKNKYDDIAPNVCRGDNLDQIITPLTSLVQLYPIQQIRTPIAIFYGGIDYLTDVQWLIAKLPKGSIVNRIEEYEHLDMMWAVDAPKLVMIEQIYC